MNDTNLTSETFLTELMKFAKNIVWKNKSRAYSNELPEYAIYTEQFMAAKKGMLSFFTIYAFDEEVIRRYESNENLVASYANDKYSIPESIRDVISAAQIEYIITTYDETNNYYRMLNGEPDLDDTDYVYNTKYPYLSDDTTPIHELPLSILFTLESLGYIDELTQAYPDKKYLKYLASKKIDPFTARISERFSILYMPSSIYENISEDFQEVYDNCKVAITKLYYRPTMQKYNTYYENFLAMCILLMSIQMMLYKYLDADITRDFYDLESIQYIYNSYSVPFFPSIPIEYHKEIVKNINILLSYKGSTRVFYELFDLFDYGAMEVHEYFLMKIHKFENGKPVFILNDDGSYNTREMYDIKFGKVKLYNNPPMELSDKSNHVDYDEMVATDPLWVSDEELMNKLYGEEYNYMETKYMGIQTVYDTLKINYEASIYFKMILDNRDKIINSTIYFSETAEYIDIFTMCIYTSALVCKKYSYELNIYADWTESARVLGFDFKKDLSLVIKDIKKSVIKDDTEIINILTTMDINNLESVNRVYKNIASLKELLEKRMVSAPTNEIYWAYYNLRKSLLYSEFMEGNFKKSNGKTATSYEDLLEDLSSTLYTRMQLEDLDIEQELTTVIAAIKRSASNLKYLNMSVISDVSIVIEYIFKLLDVFKSAKADLTGYNIVYTLSSSLDNYMKFIDAIEGASYKYGDLVVKDMAMLDKIEKIKALYNVESSYTLTSTDELKESKHQSAFESRMRYNDIMNLISEFTKLNKQSMTAYDMIMHRTTEVNFFDELYMRDNNFLLSTIITEHEKRELEVICELSDSLILVNEVIYPEDSEEE